MASSKNRLVIGYLSALGTMLSATSSASCTQALQDTIPHFQLSVARSLVQCIFYIIAGKIFGSNFEVTIQTIPGLLYLGVTYLGLNVGFYGATAYLPLTESGGIFVIANIATSFLHSKLFFNIEITKSKITSFLVCVLGIILTAQPSWLFHIGARISEAPALTWENGSYSIHRMNNSSHSPNGGSNREVLLGYILGVLGGASAGLQYDINGIILKGMQPIVKVTYGAGLCVIGSVVLMFYMEDPVLMMTVTQFMLVLGHGVLSAINSFLFVQSAHLIPGPTLSAVYSLGMVFNILSQYTIMHSVQPGNYNWIEVLGCGVIMFGASVPPIVDILVHRAKSNELP